MGVHVDMCRRAGGNNHRYSTTSTGAAPPNSLKKSDNQQIYRRMPTHQWPRVGKCGFESRSPGQVSRVICARLSNCKINFQFETRDLPQPETWAITSRVIFRVLHNNSDYGKSIKINLQFVDSALAMVGHTQSFPSDSNPTQIASSCTL